MRVTLTKSGYEVIDARSGEESLLKLRDSRPDLILLDMNLAGMSGLETCREIRSVSSVPIIIVSVRNSARDKISALDVGADDYVTKPFSLDELLARIRSSLRRTKELADNQPRRLVFDHLEIDFETRLVLKAGESIHLTPKEFALLHYLASHAGQPVGHRRLLQAVWGPDYGDELEYLRVFVNQLRKKIEPDASRPQYLLTEPCVGYRFAPPSIISR